MPKGKRLQRNICKSLLNRLRSSVIADRSRARAGPHTSACRTGAHSATHCRSPFWGSSPLSWMSSSKAKRLTLSVSRQQQSTQNAQSRAEGRLERTLGSCSSGRPEPSEHANSSCERWTAVSKLCIQHLRSCSTHITTLSNQV